MDAVLGSCGRRLVVHDVAHYIYCVILVYYLIRPETIFLLVQKKYIIDIPSPFVFMKHINAYLFCINVNALFARCPAIKQKVVARFKSPLKHV